MRLVAIIYLLLFSSLAFTQSVIQTKINQLATSDLMKHGNLGIAVIEVNSGKMIASNNANKSHIPASTLKAVTTASALKILGGEYRFKTELQYDGVIKEGILTGNLYIKGYGDPTLGSDQMEEAIALENLMLEWVDAIKKAGIRQINGAIVGDASYYKGDIAGGKWQWADLGNYYASGTWGLNMHENLYYLSFQQTSKLGATPSVAKVNPSIPNLYFMNELRSAGSRTGDNAYIYGGPYAYTRFIRGTIPVGSGLFTIKGSIPDPPFFAAHTFLYALEDAGLLTSKKASTNTEISTNKKRQLLHTHYSPRLTEIARRTNFKSVNLYAESLIRAIGAAKNANNSLEGGIKAIEEYWKLQGLDMDGFFLLDGSGLSPRNGITPAQLAGVLRLAAKDKALFEIFYPTLPIGGRSGTIKYMFKNTIAEGNIRAKSGSLERVRSYAGYAKNSAGQLLAFAVIANDYTTSSSSIRKQLEQLMVSFCR